MTLMHTDDGPDNGRIQHKTAKLAGLLFLIAMATGLFAEFYVHFPSSLVIGGDGDATARNVASHGRLYRIGIANNLLTFAIDIVLIWSLYQLFRGANRALALLALGFRFVETVLACVAITYAYVAMELAEDGVRTAAVPGPSQLQSLSVLHNSYALTFVFVAVFLALGSLVFNYLFYRYRYVPKFLSIWGISASALLLVSQFSVIIFPESETALIPVCYIPIALHELMLGAWLLIFGSRTASRISVSPAKPNG